MFWIFRKKTVEPLVVEDIQLAANDRLTEELKELLAGLPYERPVCPVCKNNDFITGVAMGMQREAPKPWNKYMLTSQGKSMGGCVLDYGIPAWKCLRCNDRFNSDMSVFVELDPYGDS